MLKLIICDVGVMKIINAMRIPVHTGNAVEMYKNIFGVGVYPGDK